MFPFGSQGQILYLITKWLHFSYLLFNFSPEKPDTNIFIYPLTIRQLFSTSFKDGQTAIRIKKNKHLKHRAIKISI